MIEDSLHFHWRLVQGGEEKVITVATQNDAGKAAWPDLKMQGDFCKIAEKSGIESVLVDINYGKPDSTLLTLALGREAQDLGFIVAIRSGLLSPTLFTQQINTLSTIIKGRIYLNMVAGYSPLELKIYGDFLEHKERYEHMGEFLNICTQFWDKKTPVNLNGKYLKVEEGLLNIPYVSLQTERPFIFIAGGSQSAMDHTIRYGDCWMQLGDTPERIKEKVKPVIAQGKSAGLRFGVICRETNEEALNAAHQLSTKINHNCNRQKAFISKSDSKSMRGDQLLVENEWPSPNLWTGVVKTIGPTGISIVGSYEEVALKFMEYKKAGVTHFILSGWPKLEEMKRFGAHVIPLIRKMEERKSPSIV